MTPLSIRRRKELASLGRRKGRDEWGQMLLEGTRSVQAALDAGAGLIDVVLSSERSDLVDWAERTGVPVWVTSPRELSKIADVRTSQGVVAAVALPEMDAASLLTASRLLVLDGVQDPGNVGTLIRSAAWFGAECVLAGPGTADFFAPKAARATMGALWDVRLFRTDDLVSTLVSLNRPIWLADLTGTPFEDWRPSAPAALVLGSEAHGPSAAVRDVATGRVCIPASGVINATESLNVASAGAILLSRWSAAS